MPRRMDLGVQTDKLKYRDNPGAYKLTILKWKRMNLTAKIKYNENMNINVN